MKTITFYSYKGGVGRSLALANVANRLAEFGKSVCLLDFDLEAPGLHLKFQSNINGKGVKKGIVDYIHDFTTTNEVPGNIWDYVTPVVYDYDTRSDISLIAAGNTLDMEYWRKLSSIDWKQLFYEPDSVGIDFLLNLKEQIRTQINPDVLLIDSRTGITDISGVTLSIFADEVVLFAANNKENFEGISQVIKTLAVPSNSINNQVPKINFVLTRIPYFPKAEDKPKEANVKQFALRIINQNIQEANIKDLHIKKALVIHSDPELELRERLKISYYFDDSKSSFESPIGRDYLELFEEITTGIISNRERKAFNNFMSIESQIQKAKATTDIAAKVTILESVLEQEPNSTVALNMLGTTYYEINMFQRAIIAFDQAYNLDKNSERSVLIYKASTLLQLGKHAQSRKLYEKANDLVPNEPNILLPLSHIYYIKKEYNKALATQLRTIELLPESDDARNAQANTLRVLGEYEKAFEAIYKALEINPRNAVANGTLAEIYAAQGNLREFYKNTELSFSFGITSLLFQSILEEESIYAQFYNDKKFLSILEKYEIEIDWKKVKAKGYSA